MKTTLEILENEIHWKINTLQEGEDYDGRLHYLMALEGVLRNIKGLKDEEKRLIINAWDNGYANGYDLGKFDDDCNPNDAEQYFNETFKKTKQ